MLPNYEAFIIPMQGKLVHMRTGCKIACSSALARTRLHVAHVKNTLPIMNKLSACCKMKDVKVNRAQCHKMCYEG